MSSQNPTPKEKYEALIKEIRLQKSIPVLEKIYEDLKSNKDNLFNDAIVPYKFSSDLIFFLLYNFINIKIQMDIFKLYIEVFLDPKTKIENINKIQFFFDIFYFDSNFFSKASTIGTNFTVFLIKFFDRYYPRKTSIKHKEGDIMDIYETEPRNGLYLPGWIQLKLKKVDEEKNMYFFQSEENKDFRIPIDNFIAQERNTFVTEEEIKWRLNLKPGDKLDFLTENKIWVEAEVKENILSP